MILAICPCFDITTKIISKWLKKVIKIHNIKRLRNSQITRKYIKRFIENNNPKMIIFYDHGQKDHLYTEKKKNLLNWSLVKIKIFDTNNTNLMQNRSIYTLACKSAKELLPKMINDGAICAWGYNRKFGFYPGKYEKWFETQANCGIIALLSDKTLEEAKNIFIFKTKEMVKILEKDGKSLIADQLIHNLNCLEILGDTDYHLV